MPPPPAVPLDAAQPIEVVYAKLKKGVYVVPIVWHNVVESTAAPHSLLANEKFFKFFCVAPSGSLDLPQGAPDVNSLWAQAGIQFRLVDMNGTGLDRPWQLVSVPTHVVYPPDKSTYDTLQAKTGWGQNYNSSAAVDIYAVNKIDNLTGGWGGSFASGRVFVIAGNETASLMAHELGHYLGSGMGVNHTYPQGQPKAGQPLPLDNVMSDSADGYQFEAWQITSFRDRIKQVMQQNKTDLYNATK